MLKRTIALAIFTVILAGCTPLEISAYRTIVGAKAFLDNEKKAHPECATATSIVCTDLAKATAAKDALIDAAEVYCSGPQFDTANGPCTPSSDPNKKALAAQKLNAAIANYNQILKDVKGVL